MFIDYKVAGFGSVRAVLNLDLDFGFGCDAMQMQNTMGGDIAFKRSIVHTYHISG